MLSRRSKSEAASILPRKNSAMSRASPGRCIIQVLVACVGEGERERERRQKRERREKGKAEDVRGENGGEYTLSMSK